MRQRLLALVITFTLLPLSGCLRRDKLLYYYIVGGFLGHRTNSSDEAKVIQYVSATGVSEMDAGEPINGIVPPDDGITPGGSSLNAGIDISASSTLFALTNSGKLLQFDTQTPGKLLPVRSLATGENPKMGVASPGNEFLYLVSRGPLNSSAIAPSLRIVNLTSFLSAGSIALPTSMIPYALALTPDGKYLVVAGVLNRQSPADPDGVACHLIDMNRRILVKTFQFPGSKPRPQVLVSPDAGQVFLTVAEGIVVIDLLTQSLSHTIVEPEFRLFGSPSHIAINPAGTSLFAAPVSGPLVSNPTPPPQLTRLSGVGVYDIATSTRVQHIPVNQLSTMAMAVSADGSILAIDHIVTDPVTRLNDFPTLEFFSLPSGELVATKPWTGSRAVSVTVHQLVPIPLPAQ